MGKSRLTMHDFGNGDFVDVPSAGDGVPDVPDDYVESVATFIILELKKRGYRKRITVSKAKYEPLVRITMERDQPKVFIHLVSEKYWRQTTDCRPPWVDGIDPHHVAIDAINHLERELEKEREKN